uniref:K Homology domain-containing protein n=1 Tax=Parascaris equorum TaxID=6256 RepID=A0A914RDD0_PAREQ
MKRTSGNLSLNSSALFCSTHSAAIAKRQLNFACIPVVLAFNFLCILIPNFRHPHFNFVGKILGPKGASLQAMAKQFKCHIYVLGRGSTKDRAKEQELLNSGDLQYAHYGGPLHVKVETIAPAHVAYKRVAGVLETLSNTLQPVSGFMGGRGGFRG